MRAARTTCVGGLGAAATLLALAAITGSPAFAADAYSFKLTLDSRVAVSVEYGYDVTPEEAHLRGGKIAADIWDLFCRHQDQCAVGDRYEIDDLEPGVVLH